VLAPDLRRAHLPGRHERELERPLGARSEGVDTIPWIATGLAEVGAHPIYVGASVPQGLCRHAIPGHNAGEQVIRPDSVCRSSPRRSFPSAHNRLPGILAQSLEEVARPSLLLLHEIQHLERICAAEISPPDHAELTRALGAKVSPLLLSPLLPGDLHARGPYPTILTYHLLNSLLKI
jgi:hypothetical protein